MAYVRNVIRTRGKYGVRFTVNARVFLDSPLSIVYPNVLHPTDPDSDLMKIECLVERS